MNSRPGVAGEGTHVLPVYNATKNPLKKRVKQSVNFNKVIGITHDEANHERAHAYDGEYRLQTGIGIGAWARSFRPGCRPIRSSDLPRFGFFGRGWAGTGMLRHAASVAESAETRELASKLADMLVMTDAGTITNESKLEQAGNLLTFL